MRFVAAQFLALLEDDRWLDLAGHANAMATAPARRRVRDRRARGVGRAGAGREQPLPDVLPAELIGPLQAWCFFWDWDVARHQVRWMTAWDTTDGGRRHVRRRRAGRCDGVN